MRPPLDWQRDGGDWPNRACSRHLRAGGIEWHVQIAGEGPVALLLHGAGGATHSWAGLLPALARHLRVVAPDLPGHAFSTQALGSGQSMAGMARRVEALLAKLDLVPALAVGHSAGAALAARMALDGRLPGVRALVAINGALLPFEGAAATVLPGLARALSLNPFAAPTVSAMASVSGRAAGWLRGSGLTTPALTELYARLLRRPGHVAGTLAMLAAWDLESLRARLPDLAPALTLLAGTEDRIVPSGQAEAVAERVAGARVRHLAGLGHLAHELEPEPVAAAVLEAARASGVIEIP